MPSIDVRSIQTQPACKGARHFCVALRCQKEKQLIVLLCLFAHKEKRKIKGKYFFLFHFIYSTMQVFTSRWSSSQTQCPPRPVAQFQCKAILSSFPRQMSRQALHINRNLLMGPDPLSPHRSPYTPVPHLPHTYTHHHCLPLCQHLQSKHNTMTAHKHSAGRSQRRHICDLRRAGGAGHRKKNTDASAS